MRIEDQCVNLELAKKLEELGFPQESLFYWGRPHGFGWMLMDDKGVDEQAPVEEVSAFTVAELGEMLPMGKRMNYRVVPTIDGWRGEKYHNPGRVSAEFVGLQLKGVGDDNQANCWAQLIIYLKENKLI